MMSCKGAEAIPCPEYNHLNPTPPQIFTFPSKSSILQWKYLALGGEGGLLLGERIVVGEVFYLRSLQALWSVAGPSPLGDAIFEVDLKAGQLSLPVHC